MGAAPWNSGSVIRAAFAAASFCCVLDVSSAFAQSTKPVTGAAEAKLEEGNPAALRRRKAQLEAENVQLRSTLADRKRELEEIRLIELEISGSGEARQRTDTSTVTDIRRTPDAVYGGELEARARVNLTELGGETRSRIDADRFTSFAAKKLALDLRRGSSMPTRRDVPKECSPPRPNKTAPATELERLVADCAAAVVRAVGTGSSTSGNAAQQEVARVKGAIEQEIATATRKVSDNDLLIIEVENMLGKSNDLTETIVRWTIPSLGVLLVLILLGPRLYSNAIQEDIFSTKLILELLTVYILVSTILILGLANRIQNEVLGTLLGGISGYVLGRSLASRGTDNGRSGGHQSKNERETGRDSTEA